MVRIVFVLLCLFQLGVLSLTGQSLYNDSTAKNKLINYGLGISADEESQGFSYTRISELSDSDSQIDLFRQLKGVSNGIESNQANGMSGTSTSMFIRGLTFPDESNQPLIVIDGIPFNTSFYTHTDVDQGSANFSGRSLDIDPKFIESIYIIKGLSGSVIYGEKGRNGVIIIETGMQEGERKLSINFSQSLHVTEIANLPSYQKKYGSGFNQQFGWTVSSWGAPFGIVDSLGISNSGTTEHPYDQPPYFSFVPEYQGANYPYRAYDNLESFYQNGIVSKTGLAISSRHKNGLNLSVQYGRDEDSGVIPGDKNRLTRNSLSSKAHYNPNDNWQLTGSLSVTDIDRIVPPSAFGTGNNPTGPSLFANLLFTPPNIDLLGLPYEVSWNNLMLYYRRSSPIQNPLWSLNYMSDEEDINRYWGHILVNRKINNSISLSYRVNYDQYKVKQERKINSRGSQVPSGQYNSSEFVSQLVNHNTNLSFTPTITDNITLSGIVGLDYSKQNFKDAESIYFDQNNFNVFNEGNFESGASFFSTESSTQIAPYSYISMGFKNSLHLNFSLRRDYNSNQDIKLQNSSYGINSSIYPFLLFKGESRIKEDLRQLSLNIGYGSMNLSYNDLDPEKLSEWDFGLKWAWRDYLTISASYFKKNLTDAVVFSSFNPFFSGRINAANMQNSGIELFISGRVNTGTKSFIEPYLQITSNQNITQSLSNDFTIVYLENFFSNGLFSALVPGEEYGSIYGNSFARTEDAMVIDQRGYFVQQGFPSLIANPNPDYVMDFGAAFYLGSFHLDLSAVYSKGGKRVSYSAAALIGRGVTTDTESNRSIPIVNKGAQVDEFGNITPIEFQILPFEAYYNTSFAANESAIFDASYFRIQSISLSYSIPKTRLSNLPINSMSFSISADNIFFKAFGFPKGTNIDPAINSTGIGNLRGYDFITGPTTRSFGAGIKIKL